MLSFRPAPEPRIFKNRVHLCLRPRASREEEVARSLDLDATPVADHRAPERATGVLRQRPREGPAGPVR